MIRNAVFIHVPRTNGNTVKMMYRDHIYYFSHDTALQVRKRLNYKWNDAWSFSFVRNPWERMISLYYYFRESRHEKMQTDLDWQREDFHTWLYTPYMSKKGYEWVTKQCPVNMLCDEDGRKIVDHVFRFEDLRGSHDDIALALGIKPIALRHRKRSEFKNHTVRELVVEPEDKELIAVNGAWEIEKFGYTF
jgi:hypothetical protein